MTVVALIAARGGSKGIPDKNIVDFCGRPLLAWSVTQASAAEGLDEVWVTSDSDAILTCAADNGARVIRRPPELATDDASSEGAWLHAIDEIERQSGPVDLVVAMQATSPLREPSDLERGLADFRRQQCDSLFAAAEIGDLFIWTRHDGSLDSVNYDWRNRARRQDVEEQYVESGSFYIFSPRLLRETGNRLGGRIGMTLVELWKSFEIDSRSDLRLCEALMQRFLLSPGNDPDES